VLQQTVNTLTAAAIYALFAMGYALVFGILDILNLAHAAIFMIGAFAALQAVLSWHWPLFLALPFGMLVGGATGLVLDLVAVEPLRARGAGFLSPLISTIAAAIIFENVALAHFGPDSYSFPIGAFPEGSIAIGNAVVQPVQLFIVGLSVLLMVGLTVMLRYSKVGKAIRAVAANRLAAQFLGIDTVAHKLSAFATSGVIAGLAGVLYARLHFFIDPQTFDIGVGVDALVYVIVGGSVTFLGSPLGALLITTLPEVLRFLHGARAVVNGVVLLAVILFLPGGLVELPGRLLRLARGLRRPLTPVRMAADR
jgi:branched-chain amino acid transport system permease protein